MQERLEYGFRALDAALDRVEDHEHEDKFAPLAESVIWIEMLNAAFWKEDVEADRTTYKDERTKDPGGQIIEGLRYARHRLVHDIKIYGLHGAMHFGGEFDANDFNHDDFHVGTPKWIWRDIASLAEADDKAGQDDYVQFLQGREVEPTLRIAADFLIDHHQRWLTGMLA